MTTTEQTAEQSAALRQLLQDEEDFMQQSKDLAIEIMRQQNEIFAVNGGEPIAEPVITEEDEKKGAEKKKKEEKEAQNGKEPAPVAKLRRPRAKGLYQERREPQEDPNQRLNIWADQETKAMEAINNRLPLNGVQYLDHTPSSQRPPPPEILAQEAVATMETMHRQALNDRLVAEEAAAKIAAIREKRRLAQQKRRAKYRPPTRPVAAAPPAPPPAVKKPRGGQRKDEEKPLPESRVKQLEANTPWPAVVQPLPDPIPQQQQLSGLLECAKPSPPLLAVVVLELFDPMVRMVYPKPPQTYELPQHPLRRHPLSQSVCLKETTSHVGNLPILIIRQQQDEYLVGTLRQVADWFQHRTVYEYLWQNPLAPFPEGYVMGTSCWSDWAVLAQQPTPIHSHTNPNIQAYRDWRTVKLGQVRKLVCAWSEYMYSPDWKNHVHHLLHIDPRNRTAAIETNQALRNELERRTHRKRLSPDTGFHAWPDTLPQPAFEQLPSETVRLSIRFRKDTMNYLTPERGWSTLESIVAMAYARTLDTFVCTAKPVLSSPTCTALKYLVPPMDCNLPPHAYVKLWKNYYADLYNRELFDPKPSRIRERIQQPWTDHQKVIQQWLKDHPFDL
jgi:hypothetical protein